MNNQTIPYFYIIRHILSGKMYAGAKWSSGANPNIFMVANGYTTSSKVVNSIVENEGLSSFEITRIDTNCDGMHPKNYETMFLQTNNCADSELWFNGHNNDVCLSHDSDEFKEIMLKLYGVEHYSQHPDYIEKKRLTSLLKYGDANYNNRPQFKETCLEKFGNEQYLATDDCRVKSKKTCLKKYGVDHHTKRPENEILKVATCLEKYGVDNVAKIPKNREISANNLRKINDEAPMKTCQHCLKTMKGSGNYYRWHGNNCKLFRISDTVLGA